MAVSAEVAVALRSKGAGSASAEPSSTLLGLLSTLAEPSSAATAQHSSSNGPLASASRRSSADKVLQSQQTRFAWRGVHTSFVETDKSIAAKQLTCMSAAGDPASCAQC